MYKQLIRSLELSSAQEKILNFEGDFRTRQAYYDWKKSLVNLTYGRYYRNEELSPDLIRDFGADERTVSELLKLGVPLFDVLGYFRRTAPKTIYLSDTLISAFSKAYGVSYHSLFSVIVLHEYAHLIHFALNPDEFKDGIGLFADRTEYVEAWAQYATWKVCIEEGGELLKAFDNLLRKQPKAYHVFASLIEVDLVQIKQLFLDPGGWQNFRGN